MNSKTIAWVIIAAGVIYFLLFYSNDASASTPSAIRTFGPQGWTTDQNVSPVGNELGQTGRTGSTNPLNAIFGAVGSFVNAALGRTSGPGNVSAQGPAGTTAPGAPSLGYRAPGTAPQGYLTAPASPSQSPTLPLYRGELELPNLADPNLWYQAVPTDLAAYSHFDYSGQIMDFGWGGGFSDPGMMPVPIDAVTGSWWQNDINSGLYTAPSLATPAPPTF